MSLPSDFIPVLPFSDFKWKWACLQPTEGLNDPVVLLGVLECLHKCQGQLFRSSEFSESLAALQAAIQNSNCDVNLEGRGGERNLMRNSGQYWKALGLIPPHGHTGTISLTEFGNAVAERRISQTDFAAATILSLTLPNPNIQKEEECRKWQTAGIRLHPLALLLRCLLVLLDCEGKEHAYLSVAELCRIIVPLSATPQAEVEDYVHFIRLSRRGVIDVEHTWPNILTRSNDERIMREYLLFLKHYGYVDLREDAISRTQERYFLNLTIADEIRGLVSDASLLSASMLSIVESLKSSSITYDLERKRIKSYHNVRPNQAAFRKALMQVHPKCIISGVSMPEVLEAAHIKPFAYNGADTASNGFMMRSDIHVLFDSGELRISPTGNVVLSERARLSYGESTIRDYVRIPDYVDLDNLEWRWNYYHAY